MLKKSKKIVFGKKYNSQDILISVNVDDFRNLHFDYDAAMRSIEQIKNIENSKIGNKTLSELFSYDDISFWWFFYHHLIMKMVQLTSFPINFRKFLKKNQPTEVQMVGNFDMLKIVEHICKSENINFNYSQTDYKKFLVKKKITQILRQKKSKITINKKILKRKKIFDKKFKNIPNLYNKTLFILIPNHRREIFNFKKNKIEKGEYFFHNIKNLIGKNEKVVGIDIFRELKSDEKILQERLQSEEICLPLEKLLEKNNKNSRILIKQFLKKYDQIISSKEFHDIFIIDNIPRWAELEYFFEDMKLHYYLPYWLLLLNSLYNYFLKEKPKAIFIIGQPDPTELTILYTARKLKIKTMVFQEAVITEHSLLDSYGKFASKDQPCGFPLSDKILLFGELTKNLLLKKGYPEEKLVVFGNTAMFNIEQTKKAFLQMPLQKKYNIPAKSKIILFTPTGGYPPNYKGQNHNLLILENLLQNFGNNEDYFIIVKPKSQDFSLNYEKILSKYGFSNTKVIRENLFELIFISSIVIATNSSSIFDSLCFLKPVIQVLFDDVQYPMPFDNLGVVFTTNLNKLAINLKYILGHDETKKELEKKISQFVKNYCNIPEDNPELLLQQILD